MTIPEAAYIQLRHRPPENEQGNAQNMYRILINVLYINEWEFCASSWKSTKVIQIKTIKMYGHKIHYIKQPVITLCYNFKSVGNNIRVHRAIWHLKLKLSAAEDGSSLVVVHQTRCDLRSNFSM